MIQIISKEERLEKLEQELQKTIRFYNSGNSCDQDWTKAEVILLLDNIEYEKNQKGVFENSSRKVREIIESGRLNNYEIKDGKVIEYEPDIQYEEVEKEIAVTSHKTGLEQFLEQQQWLRVNKL